MDMAVAGTYRHVGMLPSEPFFGSGFGLPLVVVDHVDVSSALVHQTQTSPPNSPISSPLPSQHPATQSSVSRKSRPMDLLRWFTTYVSTAMYCLKRLKRLNGVHCSSWKTHHLESYGASPVVYGITHLTTTR